MIIDEGVLRRAIPDTLGMQKQLAHLVNVSTRPNISVRVLPFAAGPHKAASSGQFTILEFPARRHRVSRSRQRSIARISPGPCTWIS